MTIKELEDLRDKRPFEAFFLLVDTGAKFLVPHPDYLFFIPKRNTVLVVEPSGDYHLLGLSHISGATFRRAKPKRKQKS